MDVLQHLKEGQVVGKIGPFPLYVESFQSIIQDREVSDEIMDALFHLLSMSRPGIVAINCHSLQLILTGSTRAKSRYFLKNVLSDGNEELIGPYLQGRHWTFFHCNVKQRTVTYINSLGETENMSAQILKNWSAFAVTKNYSGPWQLNKVSHTLQNDHVSCGIFTAVFAEKFLGGEGEGHLICPPIREERERLAALLFESLDCSGICTVCYIEKGKKDTCSFCDGENSPKTGVETAEIETAEVVAGKPDAEEEEEQASEKMGVETAELETAEVVAGKPDAEEEEEQASEKMGVETAELETAEVVAGKPDAEEEEEQASEKMEVETAEIETAEVVAGKPDAEEEEEQASEKMDGFYVDSLLKVASSKKAKKHFVSVEELQRRCSAPEKFSAHLMVTYLRKAKGKKQELVRQLKEAGVQLSPYGSNTTMCTKLVEEECQGLSKDLAYLTKEIPFKAIGQQLAKRGCTRQDDLSAELDVIEEVLNENIGSYSTVTHTLGPQVCQVVFNIIRECLAEKKNALDK